MIAGAITITNPEETTSMRGGFFVPVFRRLVQLAPAWTWRRRSSREAIRPAKSEKPEIREATGGCCRWLVLDPVDRVIERPSDRMIELAPALSLAGVGAAGPAPQRVRAWMFVGVAGNRSRVVLLLLGQS